MTTPAGHSITGAGLAVLFGVNPILGILAANLPDFFGHGENYKWGHSILVEGTIGLVCALTFQNYAWMVIILSHLFLDCCYVTGGLGCLWPFSNNLVSIFRVFYLMDSGDIFGSQSMKAYMREIIVLGSLFAVLVLIRRFLWPT